MVSVLSTGDNDSVVDEYRFREPCSNLDGTSRNPSMGNSKVPPLVSGIDDSCSTAETPAIHLPVKMDRKEIRLLHLEPGPGRNIATAHFHVISLLDERIPQYEAISYCWSNAAREQMKAQIPGTSTFDERKVQQGIADIRDLGVPGTAREVAARMKFDDGMRLIWVEAFCIDQSNLEDRAQQSHPDVGDLPPCDQNCSLAGERQRRDRPGCTSVDQAGIESRSTIRRLH